MTDNVGTVKARYDYEPFGSEIPAGTDGRTTAMGFADSTTGPDSFNPKFTGQVRDPETGLDYFNARYYSSAQGRFQSVDPGNAGADPMDPQTWNGYAYIGNNPLTFTDPSGLSEGGGGALGILGLLAGVAVAVDEIFGGGSHTPAFANFPFPDLE